LLFRKVLKVPEKRIAYTPEPEDGLAHTCRMNGIYTKFARAYDLAVKFLPVWKSWLKKVIPHIEGGRVLEASFGTGFLLTQFASQYETYGIDFNARMVEIARTNLAKKNIVAHLQRANVEDLPFPSDYFDCIINTMAFSGYPNGGRTLKPKGKLILLDFNYPADRNRCGYYLTKLMERGGDIIKDIATLLEQGGFEFSETEVGGWGSVHLYIARKSAKNSAIRKEKH